MFNKSVLIGTVFALSSNLNAQAVKMGEICPTIRIEGVKNYSSLSWNLDSIKNKLLILDFWSTNCGACIKSFPKMEKLQQLFGDSIQILMVTEDGQEKIDHFFDIHPKIKKPKLPLIVGDTLLKRLFPYNGLPQHVWIDDLRKVIAITSGESTTEENLNAYLAKNKVNLRQKKSIPRNWRYPDIPTADSVYFQRIRYYSYIIPSIDSFSTHRYAERLAGSSRRNHILFCNVPAMVIYLEAFDEGGKYNLSQQDVVFEIKDPSRFVAPENGNQIDDWNQKNSFIYDIRIPPASNMYEAMKEDLHRFFNVDAHIEMRDTDCLVITKGHDISGLLTKGGNTKIKMPKDGKDGMYHVQNFPFQALIARFQVFARAGKCSLPIKDETGLQGNVDFALPLSLMDEFDLTIFKAALQHYGLFVDKRKCQKPFLVLKEKRSE